MAEDDYLVDLPARIQTLAEGLPVEILRIRRDRGNSAPHLVSQSHETLDELSPHDVFARRLKQEELTDELRLKLTEHYRDVVATVTEGKA
ncbi:hypothetical protein OKW30_004675 [Paraburkholderia sp. Clong3]